MLTSDSRARHRERKSHSEILFGSTTPLYDTKTSGVWVFGFPWFVLQNSGLIDCTNDFKGIILPGSQVSGGKCSFHTSEYLHSPLDCDLPHDNMDNQVSTIRELIINHPINYQLNSVISNHIPIFWWFNDHGASWLDMSTRVRRFDARASSCPGATLFACHWPVCPPHRWPHPDSFDDATIPPVIICLGLSENGKTPLFTHRMFTM